MVKVREGVEYKTANGHRVGPMIYDHEDGIFYVKSKVGRWDEDGRYLTSKVGGLGPIVSELEEGPVRVVTLREVIPGVYGPVHVGGLDAASKTRALIALMAYSPMVPMKADELRNAALIFSQLAEALDDIKEETK